MKGLTNLFSYIQRKRHSAGYGVHSQFAFELIMDTIYTPHSYYIYKDNKNKLAQYKLNRVANIKYAELLFRLTNRFNSKKVLEVGSGEGTNTLYLSGHSSQTEVTCIEKDENKLEKAQSLLADKIKNIIFSNVLTTDESRFDAIVWDLKQYPHDKKKMLNLIDKTIKRDGFVVINHINSSKENKTVWHSILQLEELTMSFDLGTIGIGFFKPALPKLNYDLYF